jgi:hypothetical protein
MLCLTLGACVSDGDGSDLERMQQNHNAAVETAA